MDTFGWESTTYNVIDVISLTGKTVVITGATSGLGFETARALAQAGARVIVLGRNIDSLREAGSRLIAMELPGRIETAILDLADLDNVRLSARQLLERYPKIDTLVNNAGVMACPLSRTKQGFEMHFGTNHIGHFLFTVLLAPALIAGAPARVVNLSSAAHKISDLDFADPNFERSEYQRWEAYGASKTANVLFTVALDSRLADKGVRSYAVHPGVIRTNLSRHMTEDEFARTPANLKRKTVEQGAATSVWAATAPELADRGGVYLENCRIAEATTDTLKLHGVHGYALDPERAEQLWKLSEKLVGETFEV
jgi:NAD(P)-dependent dehydrogenase (short-subunit alcohol dehydrogenase family)